MVAVSIREQVHNEIVMGCIENDCRGGRFFFTDRYTCVCQFSRGKGKAHKALKQVVMKNRKRWKINKYKATVSVPFIW